MKWKISDLPTRLKLIGALILLTGLISAGWIYLKAENVPYGAVSYVEEGGILYPVMPEDSRMYRHNLELYGGKANVIMDDFRRWLAGLWHGKSLAKTIAFFSILISCGFFYVANRLTDQAKSADQSEDQGGDP